MTDGPESPQFEPDTPPTAGPSQTAAAEQKLFSAHDAPPNTFALTFGKMGQRGHISWHSDSSTAVLALRPAKTRRALGATLRSAPREKASRDEVGQPRLAETQ